MLGLSPRTKVIDLSSSEPLPPINKSGDLSKESTITPRRGICLPSGLSEYRLVSSNQVDKDVYLVWLLLAARMVYSGRVLVFLNSKSGTRRLNGVLSQCDEIASHLCRLHADMMQKQRLRSLERFQGLANQQFYLFQFQYGLFLKINISVLGDKLGVVLATDVAARGLDFDSCEVAWVVHFDVPRTAEIYIHRCGRTARANRPGRSVVMLTPSDIVRWRKLSRNLVHLTPGKLHKWLIIH